VKGVKYASFRFLPGIHPVRGTRLDINVRPRSGFGRIALMEKPLSAEAPTDAIMRLIGWEVTMTVDERLERLVARHEALSQSVELLTRDVHEMRAEMAEQAKKTNALITDMAVGIARLLNVAEIHERRLSRLEEQS
jgi:hypothetical protein